MRCPGCHRRIRSAAMLRRPHWRTTGARVCGVCINDEAKRSRGHELRSGGEANGLDDPPLRVPLVLATHVSLDGVWPHPDDCEHCIALGEERWHDRPDVLEEC